MPDPLISPLKDLVIKLCKDALNQAGFESHFFVDMAFRHQIILNAEEWKALQVENPSDLEMEKFAQKIVNEVVSANQDHWATKLVKTSYLRKLEGALISSQDALRTIEETLQSDNPEEKNESKEEPSELYVNALNAERAYVDSLMDLPFILEKVVLGLISNTPTANFQPKKTATMLAMALDTLQSGLELSDNALEAHLKKGLKLAIEIMPGDFLDTDLVDTINQLLPYLNQIIENTKKLNDAKAVLFPRNEFGKPNEKALAHRQLLGMLNVHFESLEDILNDCLLKPIEQLTQAYVDANGVVEAIHLASLDDNAINKLLKINTAFNHLDKLSLTYQGLEAQVLPVWLKDANQYYQNIRGSISNFGQNVAQGVSSIYDYAYELIPLVIRQYFTPASTNSVGSLLKEIDFRDATKNREKVMAFYSFFKLAMNSGVTGALKPFFFEKYMKEIRKINPILDAKEEKEELSEYDQYVRLEKQFITKFSAKRMAEAVRNRKMIKTDTSIAAFSKHGLTPKKMDMLALIHLLQTLETQFDPRHPIDIFDDLKHVAAAPKLKPTFISQFLLPAMQRLVTQYQNEMIIPLLENLLDNRIFPNKQQKIQKLYSNLKNGYYLSTEEAKLLKSLIQKEELNCDKPKLINELNALMEVIQISNRYSILPALENILTNNLLQDQHPNIKKMITHLKNGLHLSIKDKQLLSSWVNRTGILIESDKISRELNKPQDAQTHSTPKELQKQHAASLVGFYAQKFEPLLNSLNNSLDNQLDACQRFLDLNHSEGQEDSELVQLCNHKMEYIEAIQNFLIELQQVYRGPLNLALTNLLTGEMPLLSFESLEQQRKSMSVTTLSGKLLQFIGTALPNETFFRNLLNYYLQDSLLGKLEQAEKRFTASSNAHPVSAALITVLADPLSVENLMPSKEKIMDEVVDQLLNQGISLGLDYLKQAAAQMSSQYLIQLMPYPFIGELVFQVINSDPVQRQINNKLNGLVQMYGHYLGKATQDFKEQVKIKLYPMLNIEMQKAIQNHAYHFALNYVNEGRMSDTERDAFVMYFLQYKELKANKPDLSPDQILSNLFADFLEHVDNVDEVIETLSSVFRAIEHKLYDAQVLKMSLGDELAFLIATVDFTNPEQETLIQLALINRLLLIQMKASEKQNTILQDDVVNHLSDLLKRAHKQLPAEAIEYKSSPEEDKGTPSQAATYQAIHRALSGTPNKSVSQTQLKNLTKRLKTALQTVGTGIKINQVLLNTPDLLDMPLVKWEYKESTTARKLFYGLKIVSEVVSFVFTLAAIVVTCMAAAGLTGLLMAALFNVGTFILGPMALLRFGFKLFYEFKNNQSEFEKASTPTFVWLIFKCIGLALAKTLLSDYLLVKLNTLFSPFQRLRTLFFSWPSQTTMMAEQKSLTKLSTELNKLMRLVEKQEQFLDGKMDPLTNALVRDQSIAIQETAALCENRLQKARTVLNNVNKETDARFPVKNHQTILVKYNADFALLSKEIKSLVSLQEAQNNVFSRFVPTITPPITELDELKLSDAKVEPIENISVQPKTEVIVSLKEYRERQLKAEAMQSSSSTEKATPRQGYAYALSNYIWAAPSPKSPMPLPVKIQGISTSA